MQWYYIKVKDGKQCGPVEEAELLRLAQAGEIQPTDWVWNASFGDQWRPASSVPDLFRSSPMPASAPRWEPSGVAAKGERTPNRELMWRARESLRGQWGLAIAAWLLYMVIYVVTGICVWFILAGPMTVGLKTLFLSLARQRLAGVRCLFEGFKAFGTALGAYLLIKIFVFLWSLLFIVPGIVASYSYSMTYYLLADDPSLGPWQAIRRSKQMMRGYKWKLFCLGWRFFGWYVLCAMTFGIGLSLASRAESTLARVLCIMSFSIGYLWLEPYIEASKAHFYEDVRATVGTA